LNEEKEEKVRKEKNEVEDAGRELRYTQQVVASELAGWQDLHEKMGRKAIKDLVKGVLIVEKARLEGMNRAMRRLKLAPVSLPESELEPNPMPELIPGPMAVISSDSIEEMSIDNNGGPA
jgi:hypothetical protein